MNIPDMTQPVIALVLLLEDDGGIPDCDDQRSVVLVRDVVDCDHDQTICNTCFDAWSCDYYIEIQD